MTPETLMSLIASAPSPYHASFAASELLERAGFRHHPLDAPELGSGPGWVRRGGLLVAWAPVGVAPTLPRYLLIGAHTDSPNLRVKPRPDLGGSGLGRLAAEPYGGVLLNSWLDRDLGLSGRVAVMAGDRVEERRFAVDDPVARVPQLAIHLDPEANTGGLRLDPQQHLHLLWSGGEPRQGDFVDWLAAQVATTADAVVGFDVMAHDVVPPARWGREREFLSSARLDNLCSAFGAVGALIDAGSADADPSTVGVVALFDHEEVGSVSATGAASAVLSGLLDRLAHARGIDAGSHAAMLARSSLLSMDMAHGTHPNYPERHEPSHPIRLGAGPVIKTNVAQRYATDARSGGSLVALCRRSGIPTQTYAHRADLACGSTIGPTMAANLGVDTVDVGMAQLSMHSIRETMAVADVAHQDDLMRVWFTGSV